jgi:hypothetical protein
VNGEWAMVNGEWVMVNGEWGMGNGEKAKLRKLFCFIQNYSCEKEIY